MKRFALLPVLFACGGSSTSTPSDAGADVPVIKAPTVHRLLPEACPTDRPASPPCVDA